MDQRTSNRYRMLLSIQEVLQNHAPELNNYPVVVQAKTELDQTLGQIRTNLHEALPNNKEATVNKKKVKEALANQLNVIRSGLLVIAKLTDDPGLANKLALSPKGFTTQRETAYLAYSSVILEEAAVHAEQLTQVGVAPEWVEAAQALRDEFHDIVSHNRVQRKEANRLKAVNRRLVEKAVELLNDKVDYMIPIIQRTNKVLSEAYERVRKIDNR